MYNYTVSADSTTLASGLFAFFAAYSVVMLAISIFMIIAMWKVFVKAGKPGWAAIVPFYNIIVMLEIAGKPTWWIILYFIPFVNVIIALIVINGISKAFGKDVGFTLGLIFLSVIFWPILGFGKAAYIGNSINQQQAPQQM